MNRRNSLEVAGMMARSIKLRKLTTTKAGKRTNGERDVIFFKEIQMKTSQSIMSSGLVN